MTGTRPFRAALRFLAVLLSLTALLSLPAQAAGEDGGFYSRHADECVPDGRSYRTNGTAGYVTVYSSPLSERAAEYLLNENDLTILSTWQDSRGGIWGRLRYESLGRGEFRAPGDGSSEGWIRMSELLGSYDKERFVEDHLDEFVMEDVMLDMRDFEVVYLWPWPGSGGAPAVATWYLRTEEDNVLNFPAYWRDSQGRRWGGYSFFDADGFICLDQPGLEENRLPEISYARTIYPAADGRSLPRPEGNEAPAPAWLSAALPAAAGAVLLLAAGAVLAVRRRKHKEEE